MFNFKKIASVLASAVMLSSTIGFAAAASYPEPFVTNGVADAAVVYGDAGAISDVTAAINVQQRLGSLATSGDAGTSAAVSGDAAPLFSGGTKLYVNDSLNTVTNVLTDDELPVVLADTSFSGNVDSSMTQTIDIGSNPRVTFKRQPTSSDEPGFALQTSTTQANYIYNATITFNKAVNFSHADSEGEDIELFGQTYTISSATDNDNLILLKSAEKLSLDSDSPVADVTIDGSVYTIELVSASDTSATVKVTDSSGSSESKEINEAASKKINGITVAVTTADETNLKLSATVVAGSDKITLNDGSNVQVGEDDTVVDGTLVSFEDTTTTSNITKLAISVYAPDSDQDAIKNGEVFVDPVFGSFKVDFAGLSIADDGAAREEIKFTTNGDDKIDLTFTDHRGKEKTFTWAQNRSAVALMRDDDFRNITVAERGKIKDEEYTVVGNEDEGYLLRLSTVKNQTTGTDQDKVIFTDVFSGETYETVWSSDGTGTMSVKGKSYSVSVVGPSSFSSNQYNVTLGFPDSTGNDVIVYPTIQTNKGAKVALYEPLTIDLSDDNNDGTESNISNFKFPDGDGYTSIAVAKTGGANNWTINSVEVISNGTAGTSFAIGQLAYFVNGSGSGDSVTIKLRDTNGAPISNPAVVIFEEKDDNSNYEAWIATVEVGGTGDDGLGINKLESTWTNDSSAWSDTSPADSKKTLKADLFGAIVTEDSSDSDQKDATLSYPDEQIYAQIYVAEESAAITPGAVASSGSGGQVLIVKDNDVASVAGKNLVVVGGSCINTAAAKILGSDSPVCTSGFTDATGVGSGQYIIKSVTSPYSDDKVATLVAGYNAADTTNAVSKFLEGSVTTDAGTEQVYPIASA